MASMDAAMRTECSGDSRIEPETGGYRNIASRNLTRPVLILNEIQFLALLRRRNSSRTL